MEGPLKLRLQYLCTDVQNFLSRKHSLENGGVKVVFPCYLNENVTQDLVICM